MTKGTKTTGLTTCTAAAAIKRGQILKYATDGKVTPCTAATDAAVFIALDDAASGDRLACAILGSATGTQLALATGTITPGAFVNPLGAVAAAGNTVVGRALDDAKAGEFTELAHAVSRTL